jgi:predicted secreted protein
MGKVNGSALFVTVGLDRVAKSTAYNLSAEMSQLDKTSNESGFFTDHVSRLGSWSLSSDSLYIQDGFSFGDLYNAYINRERIYLSAGQDDNLTFIGLATIESLSQSAPMEQAASITATFKGVGGLYPTILPAERFIIDELLEIIIDQDGNFLVYT